MSICGTLTEYDRNLNLVKMNDTYFGRIIIDIKKA